MNKQGSSSSSSSSSSSAAAGGDPIPAGSDASIGPGIPKVVAVDGDKNSDDSSDSDDSSEVDSDSDGDVAMGG